MKYLAVTSMLKISKFKIMGKREMRKLGIKSSDAAGALVLRFYNTYSILMSSSSSKIVVPRMREILTA